MQLKLEEIGNTAKEIKDTIIKYDKKKVIIKNFHEGWLSGTVLASRKGFRKWLYGVLDSDSFELKLKNPIKIAYFGKRQKYFQDKIIRVNYLDIENLLVSV